MNIDNIPTGTTQISRQQIANFPNLNEASVGGLIESLDLKMSKSEIKHCQNYYKKSPNSSINIDEIKIIDAVVRDGKKSVGNHLLTTLTTSKKYIAKTYEDMMARRRAVNPEYQGPPSVSELTMLLPNFLKDKAQKGSIDDMAIFTGKGKYALAESGYSKSVVEIGAGKANALVASGRKAPKASSSLLIGDTLYAILKSFNTKKGFSKKLSELLFTNEYSLLSKSTAYINGESVITYLASLPHGVLLHTKPYERKTESYSCFADYAAADEGVVFAARKEAVADALTEAQELGLVVIKLGTLVAEKTISAYSADTKVLSLSQEFLKTLVFPRLISATLNGECGESVASENSMYISTNQHKYRLCSTYVKQKNAFLSALNTIVYNYSYALSSGAEKDEIICGGVFDLNDEAILGDGISLILGAYRAEAELSLIDFDPKIENGGEDASFSFYALSRVNNNIPGKLVGGGSFIYYLEPLYNEDGMPDFDDMRKMHSYVRNILKDGTVLSILPTTDDFEASFKKIKGRASCETVAAPTSHFGGFIVESTKKIDGILVAHTEKKETVNT